MVRELSGKAFFVGVQDRVSKYFDNLMPLPQGTSYNSYLVKGSEKTALIDTVDPRFADELLRNVAEAGAERVDFIVANHAEQDHAGSLPKVLERYPEALVVCNEKCKHALQRELHLPEAKFFTIGDGQELLLGGYTLRFIFAPWVHWPETMFTYLVEEGVLFTCDLYGAHLASDEPWVQSTEQVEAAAKRYYAEIMMPFSKLVAKYTQTVKELAPLVLAPSHGPAYRDPGIILGLHERWTSEEPSRRVVLAYVTMHRSTERMAQHLEWKLKEQGVPCTTFDIMEADVGEVAMALINCATLVVASPEYLGGLHPAAANLLFLLNGFRPAIKYAGFMGSHGWEEDGGAKQFKEMLSRIKAEFLTPVLIEGYPRDEEFQRIDGMVEDIKQRHQGL